MTRPSHRRTFLGAALVACAAVVVGGCSADDVELNGSVFNAIGFNQPKAQEPKLAARTPLTVPPTTDRLPAPGQPAEAKAIDMTASINDPDRSATVNKAELERQQAEYCKKNYELAKAHGDNDADYATGPMGPCRSTILTAIQKWNSGDKETVEEESE